MNAKLMLGVLACVVVMAAANGLVGQEWGGYPYAPAWCGYGYPGAYSAQSIPYFALHPPVYYSYRVPRTYGYSPFAYPPGVLTPGSESVRGAVYLPAAGEGPEPRQERQPLRIDNPFVEQSGRPGVTKTRNPPGRRPQVVYPAALAAAE
jgi:hypothetical protein